MTMSKKHNTILFLLLSLILFCGCKEPQETSNPFYKRGLALEASHQYSEAESAYLLCLGRHPNHKAVLYRLGFLYECYLNQPALAIHYYQNYLPHEYDRRKEQVLREKIEELQKEYLNILLETSAGQEYSESVAQKLEENYATESEEDSKKIQTLLHQQSILRNKVLTLTRALDIEKKKNNQIQANAVKEKTQVSSNVTPPTPPANLTPPQKQQDQIYVVKVGDTLGQISKIIYGTTKKWRLILEKNYHILKGSDKNLRPGMRLVIPNDQDQSALEEPVG